MPIEERLRSGLGPQGDLPTITEPAFLRAVVNRVEHRRKVRQWVAISAAAACAVAVIALVPWALRGEMSDDVPVDDPTPAPTTVTDTWTFDPQTTPIDGDGSWGTRAITRAARLAALDGTGLEPYGAPAFRKAYPRWPEWHTPGSTCDCAVSSLGLGWGTATLRSGFTDSGGAVFLEGSFAVRGHHVTFDFDGVGRSTYRWELTKDHRHLTFTFVSAEPGSTIFGLPAEVTLRMLMTGSRFGGNNYGS